MQGCNLALPLRQSPEEVQNMLLFGEDAEF